MAKVYFYPYSLSRKTFSHLVFCLKSLLKNRFLIVIVGWVLFRADNMSIATEYLRTMFSFTSTINVPIWSYLDYKTLCMLACGLLGAGLLKKLVPLKIKSFWRKSAIEAVYLLALYVWCLVALASSTYNPFIYFQF